VVTLIGRSSSTSHEVFANNIYLQEDIKVGWQFAPVLQYAEERIDSDLSMRTRVNDSYVKLDMKLVHDILPQNFGGNEPLGDQKGSEKLAELELEEERNGVAIGLPLEPPAEGTKNQIHSIENRRGGLDSSMEEFKESP